MKITTCTQNQIIAMLKQNEQGVKVGDIPRANGISDENIYLWKTNYGGVDVKELKTGKRVTAGKR